MAGGVEDSVTLDQPITPWTISVASGYSLMRDPRHNKGHAFTEKERDAHYLRGLLPPAVLSQELREKKMMDIIRQYTVPLHRYLAMIDLQERNERLFYKLLIDNVEELLPVVHTPTVGEACQKFGSIFKQPQGGRFLKLKNWPERTVQVIVVNDGKRILGLGDLGCQEYADLLQEFMYAVRHNYGEEVLIQFKDFANHNAFELLARYSSTHLVFNDDIQGTASAVLAGLLSALRLLGGTLADHTFLFLGAGEAGTGIADLIALEISEHNRKPIEENRNKIWLVDSKEQDSKKPWAHEHKPVTELINAVNAIKPTILIGTSGVGKQFTKEVEAIASLNKTPLIMALSNSTSRDECTAEEAYTWRSCNLCQPFDPFEYDGKIFVPIQANNSYIFPGFGLGLIISGSIRVRDAMLSEASKALASQVAEEHFEKGMIYPPFKNIRNISANIAAKVATKAYELGLASNLPQPEDLVKYAEKCMYSTVFRSYL
ncbi:NADP-dependent malic enzyme [Hibiscus syriacus]|uniref:NADP-dependent malic enzyme n=1 Tax=Hibiscus syriacus TaxID=106335 RepID=A0A6A3CVV2_HIBSY|nr:NADP-dependent malic enzyme [Hibiscus syriacus]